MSDFNKKGFTSIPVRDPKTGNISHIAVKIGSPLHKRHMRGFKKWQKERAANNRNYKNMMKVTKKLQRQEDQS